MFPKTITILEITKDGPRVRFECNAGFIAIDSSMVLETIDADELRKYLAIPQSARPAVQDAFPNASADDREFLISGTTPEAWDAMCAGIEED